MRVIAGSRRRLLLKTVDGMDTRPTTDRIKETLFNMINNDVYDGNFLDLFAGSGQIGIEALSRGANIATFVETSKKAIDCIKFNIENTKFQEQANIIQKDAVAAINYLAGKQVYDLVFMDPPYNQDLEKKVLEALQDSDIIDSDSLIIVEADLNTDFSYVSDLGFEIIKDKVYKTNKHVFLQRIS